MREISFSSAAGERRTLYLWESVGAPKAVLHIVHGMAEHIARYHDFAKKLNAMGIAVGGADLPGHGPQTDPSQLGHFAKEDGMEKVLADVRQTGQLIRGNFPGVPYVLMGHSMGSFISRECVLRFESPDALLLSGTGHFDRLLSAAALALSRAACLIDGGQKPSKFLDKLVFSGNNKPFEPARTALDWLSRDEKEVDKYIADPYCGFPFTGSAYRDFFGLLKGLTHMNRLKDMQRKMPVLFISGAGDPVGGMSKGVRAVARQFQQAGMEDIGVRLYQDARHELINELNRDEVIRETADWIIARTRKGA
ncbi:MAG: alpha/beta hydrolase [Eubacteriales bacterium]|nr:alpha/beta hydrolase [Eubacteriales bacterium]MDD4104290.1 alpha/beta hydrolase [Eubacteriales bacterium]MDD4709763.1 alpha/beta hydrolase [Eubacteriales bacterium]